jgi:hypothetical protein
VIELKIGCLIRGRFMSKKGRQRTPSGMFSAGMMTPPPTPKNALVIRDRKIGTARQTI